MGGRTGSEQKSTGLKAWNDQRDLFKNVGEDESEGDHRRSEKSDSHLKPGGSRRVGFRVEKISESVLTLNKGFAQGAD